MSFGRFLARRALPVVVVMLLLTVALAPGLRGLVVDPSFESYLPPDDKTTHDYREFLATYGNDGVVLLGLSTGERILSKTSRAKLDTLVAELAADPAVESVLALSTALLRKRGAALPFGAEMLLAGELDAAAEARIRAAPFVEGFLLGRDGAEYAALMLFTRETVRLDLDTSAAFVGRLRALKARVEADGGELALTGVPVLKVELRQAVIRDLVRLTPISFVCVTLCLMYMLRSFRDVVIAQLTMLMAWSWSFSVIGWLGWRLSNLTATLPSVIFVVGVADTIHIVTVYRLHRSRGMSKAEALPKTFAETFRPCLLTSVTTMLGFLSLAIGELPPIREYGVLAACGVFAAFSISMLFVPAALYLCDRAAVAKALPRVGGRPLAALLGGCERAIFGAPRRILCVFVALTVVAIAGIPLVEEDTDFFGFLPESSEVNQGAALFGEHFAGIGSYEILLDHPDGFDQPHALRELEAIEARVASWPDMRQTVSVIEFLKLDALVRGGFDPGAYALPPDSAGLAALRADLVEREGFALGLERYVRADWKQVRLSAWAPPASSERVDAFRDSVQVLTRDHPHLTIVKTGSDEVFFRLAQGIVTSQKNSFFLAVLTIIVAITLLFVSWRMGLFSVLPNIFPLAVAFGLMAYVGIPLNTATAMVVPITLGIAVDDTIHFLAGYRRFQRAGRSPREAVRATLEEVGSAISATSVILVLGFAALLFGSFHPTRHFAILTICTVGAAWLGDMLLLPVLLDRVRPDFTPRGDPLRGKVPRGEPEGS